MLSDELRNMKPCAIPVRVMPFHSLTDAKVREIRDELNIAMVKKGFVVVGFVKDGEWTSLDSNTRFKRASLCNSALNECKKESTSTNINTIKRYFELIPGTQQPRLPYLAIPLNDILFFDTFCQQASPGAVIPVDRAIVVFC